MTNKRVKNMYTWARKASAPGST